MPSFQSWDPNGKHVQGGLREGQFINSQFVLLCAGPPFWSQMAAGGSAGVTAQTAGLPVYPIGVTQSFSHGQSKAIQRIFEVGSDRSYAITGRTVGQVSLGRTMYHGPSLLRVLYAYYNTMGDKDGYAIEPLIPTAEAASIKVIQGLGSAQANTEAANLLPNGTNHSVKIPPGYDNLFINLASDLFSQPIGILCVLKDNSGQSYGAFYLENCLIPQHSWGFDANGLIVSEQTSINYERLQPVQTGQIKLLRDIGSDNLHYQDMTGGFTGGGKSTST